MSQYFIDERIYNNSNFSKEYFNSLKEKSLIKLFQSIFIQHSYLLEKTAAITIKCDEPINKYIERSDL